MRLASHRRPHIRQGDVLLIPVDLLPAECTEILPDGNRIVLAHGEVTGHAHAIYDHAADADPVARHIDNRTEATEIADTALAGAKARLWQTPNGARFLEVSVSVTLRHEEHTAHTVPPGIYKLPRQVEYTPQRSLRRVTD